MRSRFSERARKARLTTREQHIAGVIAAQLSRVAFMPGPQLARACGVSVSAVTRFAQKLGYAGFPELKLDLEAAFRETITPHEMFKEFLSGARQPSVARTSIAQDLQNIVNMQQALDESVVRKVAATVDHAKTVYSVAISGSEVAVHLLTLYFRVLGKPHQGLIGYGISKRVEFTPIGPQDVLIAVCSQRIFREVRDVAVFARQRGARTIAITDSATNALATVCDLVLIAPVVGATFGYSHAAPIAMVNVLVNTLAARNPKKSLKALETIRNHWKTVDVFCSPDVQSSDAVHSEGE
jgi:DNA-binding MurR/RpiR family transcriptional regulator